MDSERRLWGPRSLSALVPKAAAAALRRRGFAETAVIARWAEIVGPALAADSCPEKLVFPRDGGGAVLHVRAAGGLALELQHLQPVVVERINAFFGYRAVARIALLQGPLPKRRRTIRTAPRPLTPEEREGLERALSRTRDPGLRKALQALGERVFQTRV